MPSKRGCCGCSSRKVLFPFIIAFAFFGVVLLVLGLVLGAGGVFSDIIKKKVDQNVQLKPGSLVYKEWVNTTIPVYMQYFVFHLENPEEVFTGNVTPSVKQMGPYSYREIRANEVLNWTSDNSIVTFMPNRTYVFDPETSCAGCDDKNDTFVTVNIPLLSTALWVKNTNFSEKQYGCFNLLKIKVKQLNVTLFQKRSVYEILWGYTDPLLQFIIDSSAICPTRDGLRSFVQLQYNNTYYGISAVNTGRTDISKLEQFTMWRGESHLSWWSDKYANMINGTDGTQVAPDVAKDQTYYAFVPDICRSVHFVYESDVTVRDIKTYRFVAPDELYLSGDVYPPNKGFCVPPACLPTGLLNISRCQPMNPPVVVSPPHFYQGNKSLLKTVNGLHPSKSADETFIDVEPITGIVMRAVKRIQINIALEPVDILPQTNGTFKPVFLPVMFVNESALISEEKAEEFRHDVYGPIFLTKVAEYLLIISGSLFIFVALVLLLFIFLKAGGSEERKPLVGDRTKVYA